MEMPLDRRTVRTALFIAKALVVVLLLVSPRALFKPVEIVHKSKDSKRPKIPKNVVRAEPVRIPTAEKQTHTPSPSGLEAAVASLFPSPTWTLQSQKLPGKAFTQLTKPEYLKSYTAGLPPIPLAPPA